MSDEETSKSYVFFVIGVILFISLVVLYVLEYPFLSNTLELRELVKTSVSVCSGVIVVLLMIGYATRILHPKFISTHLLVSIFFMAISPYFASISNRMLSQKKPYAESYEFKEQKAYKELYFGEKVHLNTHWIVLYKDKRAFKFRTNKALPKNPNFGSKVRLIMYRGFWGFDYFDGKSWEFM